MATGATTVQVEQPPQPTPVTRTIAPAAETVSTPAAESLPHRENWLLKQPGSSYSLQLLGSRSEKSVIEFIKRHKLDEHQTAYYQGIYRGSAWYVLMFGVYPDKQAALAGRTRLPAKIRKDKPWPRTLESVHKSIREAQ